MTHIFLYGPPGSGKTVLGQQLARSLHLPFIDLDHRIVAQAGHTIPEIFSTEGEAGFRQRERSALLSVLHQPVAVVALGGGTLLDPHTRQVIETSGRVLCLNASFEILAQRLNAEPDQRPLLSGDVLERLRTMLQDRQPHYASFSCQLDTSSVSLDGLIKQAQMQLGMFHVSGMSHGYDVRIQPRGLLHLGQMLRQRKLQGPLALVSDEHVASYHLTTALTSLHQAGYVVHPVVLPPGEATKTISTIQHLWEAFLEAGLERRSTVIALGGGVVGDLAGFAAATYLRGIAWVAVPTSLLAMVDASLGGKTGADLPQGKNLVGAFHPPSLVLADPQLLSTLPEVEQRNGLVEALKHGLIADAQLFELCCQEQMVIQFRWDELVRRAMAVKIQIIQEDPFERGQRAVLNLGHTLGHALELASNYRLRHGEAVGIGILAAARISQTQGLAQPGLAGSIVSALSTLHLPTVIPADLDRQVILSAMRVDKKKAAGKVTFVLPLKIGEVHWGVEIENLETVIDSVRSG